MIVTKKNSILKKYVQLAKTKQRDISIKDLQEVGVTRDMVAHHFSSLSELDKQAREKYPESFKDVRLETIYSKKVLSSLRGDVKKYDRFIITTAVTGCDVHDGFYASLKNYCTENDAALLIMIAADPANAKGKGGWGAISHKLVSETLVLEDTRLNDNLFLSTIKLSAKHIDPTTGMRRIGQRNGSFIFASPKQRLKAAPVANNKLPHFAMTTGAITLPNYHSDMYMSQRTAYIAENDHKIGAIIVEIEDDEIYYFRQVQADASGSFVDFGKKYSGTTVEDVTPEAFVLGDWHSGSTDPTAAASWEEITKLLKPKHLVLHDAFDGLSINHHEDHDIILKSQRAMRGELDMKSEISGLRNDLTEMKTWNADMNIIIVKSNHDLFLERYLRAGKYVEDYHNHRYSLELAIALMDGKDPLKFAVQGDEVDEKVTWLGIDDDFKIEGVQLGAHGHKGSNGSRGSLPVTENMYGNSITGHTHTPEILRDSYQVGTSSYLKLEYNQGGASSWLHSSCLLYPGGSKQLINSIFGKYRLPLKKTKKKIEKV